jgi:hypothetical protein
MPPLLTFVARLSDGLPLVANTAPDAGMSVTQDHKNQAKDILRGLGGTRCVYRGFPFGKAVQLVVNGCALFFFSGDL